jgi:hypothetical protein
MVAILSSHICVALISGITLNILEYLTYRDRRIEIPSVTVKLEDVFVHPERSKLSKEE